MTMIRSFGLSLALAAGLAGTAQAAPVPGTGGGYYGSAWYNSGQGTVISAIPTWQECTNLLNANIAHAASAWGWWVVRKHPCAYRPPFGQMSPVDPEKIGIEIGGSTPEESVAISRMISDEIRRARELHRADDYDNALRTIYTSASGR